MSTLKPLVQHGNSKALIIDKALLLAAGLDESALFQIVVNPGGGLTIQSVKKMDDQAHKKNVQSIIEKNDALLRRLANL